MTSARITKKIPPGFSLDVEFAIAPGVTALYGPAGAGWDACTGLGSVKGTALQNGLKAALEGHTEPAAVKK